MATMLDVVYRIDLADRITTVTEGWVDFARTNAGDLLLPPSSAACCRCRSVRQPRLR